MKNIRSAVSQCDTEIPIALSTLKCCLKITKNQIYNMNELVGLRISCGVDYTFLIPTEGGPLIKFLPYISKTQLSLPRGKKIKNSESKEGR